MGAIDRIRLRGLEQSMVALERVKEYSILPREGPEFVEPRPPVSWPEKGKLEVQNLVVRYAVWGFHDFVSVVLTRTSFHSPTCRMSCMI